MQLQILVLAFLALLAHSSPAKREGVDSIDQGISRKKARVMSFDSHLTSSKDLASLEYLEDVLDGSTKFSATAEVIMLRVGEWLVQNPSDPTFSKIVDKSSVFKTLAEYVVESERWISPGSPSSVYSSNGEGNTFKFGTDDEEVRLSLLYRASEHEFLASAFHKFCDNRGPTITMVKSAGGQIAAFYNSESWDSRLRLDGYNGYNRDLNSRGFIALIVEDPETSGVYSLQKYVPNENATVVSYQFGGPNFGGQLGLPNRCDLISGFSDLQPGRFLHNNGGYTPVGMAEGMPRNYLFGTRQFGVSEYEVFQVELVDTI
jgi:hypothetical protein